MATLCGVALSTFVLFTVSDAQQALWSQFGQDYSKCDTGTEGHGTAVPDQSACQEQAVAVGHAFYSFRPDSSLCVSSAFCESPMTGTSDLWQIFSRGAQVVDRRVQAAANAGCWEGNVQPAICCDISKGLRGDERCWTSEFTFDLCCPVEAAVIAADVENACWVIGGTDIRDFCCDVTKSLTGADMCWNGPFSFASCCRAEAAFVKSAPTNECWIGGLTAEFCCDMRKGLRGEEQCWQPPGIFTFDLCCPEEKIVQRKHIEDTCWVQGVTPEFCCDRRKGSRGDPGCWMDQYNFESCCTLKVFEELDRKELAKTCWSGSFDRGTCCDMRKSPRGDLNCWTPPYDFRTCCPSEYEVSTSFEKQCWVPGITRELCCDQRKGAEGDVNCWSGMFAFDTCCPDEMAAMLLKAAKAFSAKALPPAPALPPADPPAELEPPAPPPPPQVAAATGMSKGDDRCWSGDFTEAFCCDIGKGPNGDERCWGAPFNFDSCCPHPVPDEL